MPVSGFFWSKVPASLDNFASFSEQGTCSVPSAGLVNFASFGERGTRSVPSARSADSGGLERRRAYQKSNFKTLSTLLKVVEIMDFCEN